MSEFCVEVVKLDNVEKHPNADTLSIAHVFDGYPVIFKTSDFTVGGKAVYISVDACLPKRDPEFSFLKGRARSVIYKGEQYYKLKASRLRGVFSMGLLLPACDEWEVGQDVSKEFGIVNYTPPEPAGKMQTDNRKDPGIMSVYKIKGLRKYKRELKHGESVVLTEKLEGSNARFIWYKDELLVASHYCWKKYNPDNIWWRVAERYQLADKLSTVPNIGIYGEVFGHVGGYPYGRQHNDPLYLAIFDAVDVKTRKFFNYDDMIELINDLELPAAPELWRGPWNESELVALADGDSLWPSADHIREGFIVRPLEERTSGKVQGRVIFKMKGEQYLLGRGKK